MNDLNPTFVGSQKLMTPWQIEAGPAGAQEEVAGRGPASTHGGQDLGLGSATATKLPCTFQLPLPPYPTTSFREKRLYLC